MTDRDPPAPRSECLDGVPIRAFFPDDELGAALVPRPALLHALRDRQLERLALRASGLSPRAPRAIAAILERAREIEGLQDSAAAPACDRPRMAFARAR